MKEFIKQLAKQRKLLVKQTLELQKSIENFKTQFEEYLNNPQIVLKSFGDNLQFLKDELFHFAYSDITRYTNISQSTMSNYDKYNVLPSLQVAKQLADFYCTDLDSLCLPLTYYQQHAQQITMLLAFLKRVNPLAHKNFIANVPELVSKITPCPMINVSEMIKQELQKLVAFECFTKSFVEISRDESISSNFNRNYANLKSILGIKLVDIHKATGISMGNTTRLARDGEAMMPPVILLAHLFRVSISQISSSEPNFDFKAIEERLRKSIQADDKVIQKLISSQFDLDNPRVVTHRQAVQILNKYIK